MGMIWVRGLADVGSVVTQPLLLCVELAIKPIQAMAVGYSSKSGIREKFQYLLFELPVRFFLSNKLLLLPFTW